MSAELSAVRTQWLAAWERAVARCDAGALVAERAIPAMPAAFIEAPRRALISLGKASVPMHGAARDALGTLDAELVIAPTAVAAPTDWDFVVHGDHPIVGEASLRAGRAALAFADAAVSSGAAVFGLVSGGASALCEAPGPGVSADDVRSASTRLLAEGLSIEAMNVHRTRLSALKGGKLGLRFGAALKGASVLVDVPSGRPEVVGSGPLAAPGVRLHSLAAPVDLARAFGDELSPTGLSITVSDRGVDMSYGALVEQAVAWASRAAPGSAWVGGGEVGVTVPQEALERSGGRARHFALACALRLAQALPDAGWLVFAGASDGRDGSGAAGALVTGATLLGPAAQTALDSFDSGAFLAARGLALAERLPTTNLCDVYAVARIG